MPLLSILDFDGFGELSTLDIF